MTSCSPRGANAKRVWAPANRANAGAGATWHPDKAFAAWRARWFILLAALIAFSGQSFVTQTHVHAYSGSHFGEAAARIGAGTDAAAGRTGGHAPADKPATCPICEAIAHAGPYLLPTQIAFVVPSTTAPWIVVTPAKVLPLPQRLRPWNSRAPPGHLHA